MTSSPEDIVRALAAALPIDNFHDGQGCAFCGGAFARDVADEPDLDPAIHEADCPWRMAMEWVAGNATQPRSMPFGRHGLPW